MLRKKGKQAKKSIINVLICDGGAGDHLCYLVVADWMIKNIPWITPLIWVPDYLYDFAKNVLPKEAKVYDFTHAQKYYNPAIGTVTTQWNNRHTPMRMHPIDYAAHIMPDVQLEMHEKNYLKFNPEGTDITRFNLPKKFIVLSVGVTTKTKELPATVITEIVDYIIECGYTPVFLGKENSAVGVDGAMIKATMAQIDYSKGIDLRNQTSLCESAAIIGKAKMIIGMEGGLMHLAGFTDTPLVISYTFVDPKRMLPIRNNEQGYKCFVVQPDESLECRFCQTRTPLLFDHNFTECFYGPNDYTCIKQLTFDKWRKQIDNVLYF